ncbi:MAG: DNA-binding protein [Gammaproteobacteria bacterium]
MGLIAAGKNPTIETIRIILGTGSNSTLGGHLRTWKARQDQTQQIATKENLPEELIAVIKGLWDRVMNQSEDKIQVIQQETQQELAQLKQEAQHLQQDNAYWQQQYQQIKQERDGLTHEKKAMEQLCVHAKIEIATLTQKNVGLEDQNQEKQVRIEELHRQNQQIQNNLEHYRTASLEQRMIDQQRYEQQQKQLEQTVQQINQDLSQVQREKLVFQQQSQQANFEKDSIKIQLDKLNEKHELIAARLAETRHELAKKTQAQQHWQEQYDASLAKWDTQNKLFIELQTQHALLSQQLLILKAELKEMSEQNKVLAHEKWIMGQEKAQLYGQLKQLESCI